MLSKFARPIVLLLAVLMVVTVGETGASAAIVATAATADSSVQETRSSIKSVSLDMVPDVMDVTFPGTVDVDHMPCRMDARYLVTTLVSARLDYIEGRLSCDVTSGSLLRGLAGEALLTVGFYGTKTGGGTCLANLFAGAVPGGTALQNPGFSFKTDSFDAQPCTVNAVCVQLQATLDYIMAADPHVTFRDAGNCTTFSMGAPPTPNVRPTCKFGTPYIVTPIVTDGSGAYAGYWGHNIDIKWQIGTSGLHDSWWWDARKGAGNVPDTSTGGIWLSNWTNSISPAGWQTTTWSTGMKPVGSGNLYNYGTKPVGVWVYAMAPGGNSGNTSSWRTSNGLAQMNLYAYGDNDPGNCVFYFGAKFRDVPGTLDDPQGPLEVDTTPVATPPEAFPPPITPNPDDTEACHFDPLDPSSWLAGGMCAAVGLLIKVFGKLKEIATAIGGLVESIMDGLLGLFVPDEGFADQAFDQVRADFDNTSLVKWLDALTEMGDGGAVNGCAGLPLQVEMPGGVMIDEHLGAACSGSAATAAGMVRTALTAVLIVGGGFTCVRVLGQAFGWSPGIGRKVD